MPIELNNLFFSYETTSVLRKVDLRVQRGEFVGIMGPNGGGKTTLLKLLMGFLTPTRGRVSVAGKIGYVPQVHQTDRDFPITVSELILLGAISKANFWSQYPREIKDRANGLIDRLGLMLYRDKPFAALSGGLAQRALLARALISDPDLLFLDEPTSNIDMQSSGVIFEMLEALKGSKTILLVTHDLKTIIDRVDRVLCVQGGVSSFAPKDICEHFALGLYHTPLMGLPPNHFQQEKHHAARTHQ